MGMIGIHKPEFKGYKGIDVWVQSEGWAEVIQAKMGRVRGKNKYKGPEAIERAKYTWELKEILYGESVKFKVGRGWRGE